MFATGMPALCLGKAIDVALWQNATPSRQSLRFATVQFRRTMSICSADAFSVLGHALLQKGDR
jgi:hypothetical protein